MRAHPLTLSLTLAVLLAAGAPGPAPAQGPAPKGNVLYVGHHVDPTTLHMPSTSRALVWSIAGLYS